MFEGNGMIHRVNASPTRLQNPYNRRRLYPDSNYTFPPKILVRPEQPRDSPSRRATRLTSSHSPSPGSIL